MLFQNIFILAAFAITQVSAAPAPRTQFRPLSSRSAETTSKLKSRQDVSTLEAELSTLCPGNPAEDSLAEKCVADHLLFVVDMPTFLSYRNAKVGGTYLDWESDGCSVPLLPDSIADSPLGFPFFEGCLRHDFGYRNFGDEGRCGERNRIDDQFKNDLYAKCNNHIKVPPKPQYESIWKVVQYTKDMYKWTVQSGKLGACQLFADTYYEAVNVGAERFCHAKRKRWLEAHSKH